MSVIKRMRGQSTMEFVECARRLELHAFQVCTKAPKRYERFLTGRIYELASTVHEEVRAANNIYPRNQHEAQMRRDHLTNANIALQNLSPKLTILYDSILQNPDKCDWIDNAMKVFGEYIGEEAKLIAATKKADSERYKDLPDLGGEYDQRLRRFTELFIRMCKKLFGISIDLPEEISEN